MTFGLLTRHFDYCHDTILLTRGILNWYNWRTFFTRHNIVHWRDISSFGTTLWLYVYCHGTFSIDTALCLIWHFTAFGFVTTPWPILEKFLYTLSEAWSGVNWADLMAAQSAFGTDFYDRSTRTIVGTMLWTEYIPVIKIGPKDALGSHDIRPNHSAPRLRQSIDNCKKASIGNTINRKKKQFIK